VEKICTTAGFTRAASAYKEALKSPSDAGGTGLAGAGGGISTRGVGVPGA
jgi:hypothetical protein